jgi:DNA-binding transcriptional regulator YhcF (GntR family)
MKIWVSKNSEVPVRDQLIAQITLGIAAGDLAVGERLPSTREIARRCDIHSNTVGAAYQKLVDQKLLEFRHGSGFYVAESAGDRIEGTRRLEILIENFFESAKALGFERADVIAQLRKPARPRTASRLLVVESDAGLREIIVHELSSRFPQITGISLEEYIDRGRQAATTIVAMLDEKPKLEAHVTNGQKCVYLKGRSVAAAMAGQSRPSPDESIAVVSGWDGFLSFARIMLLAANVDPGSLMIRSTSDDGWREAVERASMVICDSLTSSGLTSVPNVRKFQIVADESLEELARAIG